MGFERVTSMIQGTKGFTDFENAKISNYETDVFRPIFEKQVQETIQREEEAFNKTLDAKGFEIY
jgi:alanyl-tRNA synthetase